MKDLRTVGDVPPPAGIDRCLVLLEHVGVARRLAIDVKERNDRGTRRWLTHNLARLGRPGVGHDTVVSWPPPTPHKRRRRGFDHGEALARDVARALALPHHALLQRDLGPGQTGASRADRLVGPAVRARGPAPHHVLLVDDVLTTGATLASCARALRSAGAVAITALVATRTRDVAPTG